MIVQRKQKREIWFSTALNTLPDLVVAGVVAIIFDGGLLLFLGTFFGLQAVYFVLWLKQTLWRWILYKIRNKKLIKQRLVDFLIENEFPKTDDLVDSAESYLEEVCSNETIEVKTRLKAALDLGALMQIRNSMRMQEYFLLSMPYDEAIEEYSRKVSLASKGPA